MIRQQRPSYANADPVLKRVKAKSRRNIIACVRRHGLIPTEVMLLPSMLCVDVRLFERAFETISQFILIEHDSAVAGAMLIPDTRKYARFIGTTNALFRPDPTHSKINFIRRYQRPALGPGLNLVWLDFCGPVGAFPESQQALLIPILAGNHGMLFLTHLVGPEQTAEGIAESYRESFVRLGYPPTTNPTVDSYQTKSPMCVIGFTWNRPEPNESATTKLVDSSTG